MKREVVFTGLLREKDLIPAYACADIFILPSSCELQSIATLEAMATRKAILIGRSKENAAQKLVKEGINRCTFGPQYHKEAVEKIDSVLCDVKLTECMGEECYRIIRRDRMGKSVSDLEKIHEGISSYAGINKKERICKISRLN